MVYTNVLGDSVIPHISISVAVEGIFVCVCVWEGGGANQFARAPESAVPPFWEPRGP